MKNAMVKKQFRGVVSSLGRFLAILAIVGLGVGVFAGLKSCRDIMVSTGNRYVNEMQMFDYRLLSTLGFDDDDVTAFSQTQGIKAAEGAYFSDVIITHDDSELVVKTHSLSEEINLVNLISGRLPENANEFIGDSLLFTEDQIGKSFAVSLDNPKDTLENFSQKTYTLVGICDSVLYMNFERGTTNLGSGIASGFIYLTPEGYSEDFRSAYTEMYLTLSDTAYMYSDEYDALIERTESSITQLLEERAEIRYDDIVNEATEELNDAKAEFADGEKEYLDAEKEAQDAFADAEKKIADAKQDLNDAKIELADGEKQIQDARKTLDSAWETLTDYKEQLAASEQELIAGEQAFDTQKKLLAQQYGVSEEEILLLVPELQQTAATLQASREQLETAVKTLKKSELELMIAEDELIENRQKLRDAKQEIADGEKEIADAQEELKEEREKADKELADAKIELNDAREKILDAEDEIANLERASTYVLDRNTNVGYVCFENDSSIVEGIANIFPVFFFLVAALVCAVTMTRMVDENRTQIGLLKAMGYSNARIAGEYILYSASASLIGTVLGFLLGTTAIPSIIWYVYKIMYNIAFPADYVFETGLALISLIAALLCSVGTTWFCCKAQLRQKPSQLLRPKSPKNGKRILLERITPLWKRLSFLNKVSARNIFRDKKRIAAMILGIGGCTALLITGFGVRDSVINIVNDQYDRIMLYDISVSFEEDMTDEAQETFSSKIGGNMLFLHSANVDVNGGDVTKTATLISLSDGTQGFIDLHDGDTPVSYPQKGEVVITKKLAQTLGVSIGDELNLTDSDYRTFSAKVTALVDNYIGNYVYINDDTFTQGFGYDPEIKTAYIQYNSDDVYALAADIMQEEGVTLVSVTDEMRIRMNSMLTSLDYIVLLVLVCAAALAFIVLYNLININICEREREIATLKVLGFNKKETAAYVFRENYSLTAIGAIIGIPLGLWLHDFVMNQINIDLISFNIYVSLWSIVISIVITFLFALSVNLFMRKKLNSIDMAESLKSVE